MLSADCSEKGMTDPVMVKCTFSLLDNSILFSAEPFVL